MYLQVNNFLPPAECARAKYDVMLLQLNTRRSLQQLLVLVHLLVADDLVLAFASALSEHPVVLEDSAGVTVLTTSDLVMQTELLLLLVLHAVAHAHAR